MPHQTSQIRNVALVGHGGVGKTTIAEALLFAAGVTSRPGRVDDGTSVLDREPEEIDRRSTVSLALASFDWKTAEGHTCRVNLLDTPGHPDFEADVNAALAVADLVVIVVSATDGVEIGTEVAWHKCVQLGLPRMFFVTREDKHRADFEGVVAQLRKTFGQGVTPLELPLGEAETLHGLADVLTEQAHEYDSSGHHTEALPDDIAEHEHEIHDQVVEEIVSGDDAQLERYLEGDIPSVGELQRTLAAEVLACTEFPVLLGSGTTAVGIDELGDFICSLGPSPEARPVTVNAGGQTVEVAADPGGAPLVRVFKTISDQYMGQISLFKVVSGTLGADTTLRDTATGRDERVHAPFHLRGSEQTPAGKATAGKVAGKAGRKSAKFSEVQAVCPSLASSPLVGMFQAGYAELTAQLRVSQPAASPGAPAPRPTLRSITAVDRALLRASSIEVNKLEKRVTFLATTASITPFIGLFGTVWGIMMAFMNIGAQGSTDLAVVSGPIAEALIATALGLVAAIPAVYFYNHFTSKVKGYASEMDDFALEFLNISERNFT